MLQNPRIFTYMCAWNCHRGQTKLSFNFCGAVFNKSADHFRWNRGCCLLQKLLMCATSACSRVFFFLARQLFHLQYFVLIPICHGLFLISSPNACVTIGNSPYHTYGSHQKFHFPNMEWDDEFHFEGRHVSTDPQLVAMTLQLVTMKTSWVVSSVESVLNCVPKWHGKMLISMDR